MSNYIQASGSIGMPLLSYWACIFSKQYAWPCCHNYEKMVTRTPITGCSQLSSWAARTVCGHGYNPFLVPIILGKNIGRSKMETWVVHPNPRWCRTKQSATTWPIAFPCAKHGWSDSDSYKVAKSYATVSYSKHIDVIQVVSRNP